jgi:hypothetical protein
MEASEFLFARAETEHEVAERKRDATMTKAAAVASLGAALVAVLAAPAFDLSGLAHGATRWLLLCAIVVFVAAIALAAAALAVAVKPGDRPSRVELERWITTGFRAASTIDHLHDFTAMYVTATNALRRANEKSQEWLSYAMWAIGLGLGFLLVTFFVEVV